MTSYSIMQRGDNGYALIVEGLSKDDAAARCEANNAAIPLSQAKGRMSYFTPKQVEKKLKEQARWQSEEALPDRFEVIAGGKIISVEKTLREARRQAKIHISNWIGKTIIRDRVSGFETAIQLTIS